MLFLALATFPSSNLKILCKYIVCLRSEIEHILLRVLLALIRHHYCYALQLLKGTSQGEMSLIFNCTVLPLSEPGAYVNN